MAFNTVKVLDADGAAKYAKEWGDGSGGDPFIHTAMQVGADGSTVKPVIVIDADTGGGVQNVEAVLIAVPASGGVVAVPGDATNGLTVQGTVTVQDGGGAITVDNG